MVFFFSLYVFLMFSFFNAQLNVAAVFQPAFVYSVHG